MHSRYAFALLLAAAAGHAGETAIPTVVVTASRTAETIDEALAAVTVLDRADIERRQARSVPELLRSVPGVQISTSGGLGKASSVFLRGSNSDQVLVLVDGVKVGSATLGTTAFENLPLDEIERIEVVRGPRSSLYGPEAIGGVIQVFTRRDRGDVTPSASLGVGSFGTRRASAGVGGGDAAFSFNLSASWLDTDGYDVRDTVSGEPDDDGYDDRAVSVRLAKRLGGSVDAVVNYLRSDGHSEFDGGFVNQGKLLQQVLGVEVSADPASFWHAQLRVGRSEDDLTSRHDGVPRSRFDTRRDTVSWLNDLTFGDARELTLGLDVHRDRVDSTTAFVERERINTGAFAQWSSHGERHDLQLAARIDDNEQFGGATTGSAAWAWSPTTGVRVRASLGTAFKAPSFNQLYFPGFGNPDLDPERSRSAEIGLRGATRIGDFDLTLYRNRIRDLIAFDPITFFPENIARARILGAELAYGLSLESWRLDAALHLLDPENRSAGAARGNLLPRRPQQTLTVEVYRRFERLRIGALVLTEGRRFDDLANERRIAGYASVDLLGEYALGRHWRVQLRVENVFDAGYQTASSFNQPGRGAFLTLRYQPVSTSSETSP